jgi:hypothetical protein
MTAQELIDELKRFDPNDEIEVQGVSKHQNFNHENVIHHTGDVFQVTHNNGDRRRILITSNES